MPPPPPYPPGPGSLRAPGARRRPGVEQAAHEALVPLRPLTLGEIMDAAFLVIQRRASTMIGVPLAVATGFAAAGALLLALARFLLAGVASPAAVVLLVLIGLALALVLVVALAWAAAVISRAALRTLLGAGFAPAVSSVTPRGARHLFWPMTAFTVLAGLLAAGWYYATSLVFVAVLPFVETSDDVAAWAFLAAFLVWVAAWSWGASFLFTGLPVYVNESATAPGWIGKPHTPVNPASAMFRAVRLTGWRQSVRALLLLAASQFIGIVVSLGALVGAVLVTVLYLQALGIGLAPLIRDPWLIAGFVLFAVLTGLALCLAYAVSAQTVLYLDLRMRREGLDLAMRFDVIAPPQPDAPRYGVAGPPGVR